MSFKNGVLEAPRLDFEAPGLDFGGSEAPFFQDFRMFLAMCTENLPRTCRGLAQLVDACLRSLSFSGLPSHAENFQGGWGGGGPPLGVFNPPPTEGALGVLDHSISVRDLSDKFDSRRPFRNVLDTPLYNLSPGALGPPEPRAKFAGSAP